MKILFINDQCGYFGGAEQNIADTASGLGARGHQCFLAFKQSTGYQVTEYQANFRECILIDPFQRCLDRVRPDVIYIHKASVQRLENANSVRVIRMVHDHDLCCPRRHKYYAWSGRICRHKADWRCYLDLAFLGHAPGSNKLMLVSIQNKMLEMQRNRELSLLLTSSTAMRDELIQNGFTPERVKTLPPIVRMPLHAMRPMPNENRILYVGQLIRGKGVDLLLRALLYLRCNFELIIAGAGNARDSLERLSRRLGLGSKVWFAGWVNPREIAECYAQAKVVVVPSRWPEPFGLIGLEAMHHGRPVVAFDVGGIRDWLDDGVTGLLAPEGDVRSFANAVEQLLEDPQLCGKLGHQAQESVRAKFSFEHYVDQLETFLSGAAPSVS